MFNKIILIGNLTKDPEVKQAPGGTSVLTMGIAVNSRYKQGDESKDEALFIDAVVFGRQAETCGQYLAKGRTVLVEGRLRERRWEYEGQKKSKMEVVASSVRFLGGKKAEGQTTPPEETADLEPF